MINNAIISILFGGGVALVLCAFMCAFAVLFAIWFPFYRLLGGVKSFKSYMKKFFKENF